MSHRTQGQMGLVCDTFGAVFDNRPRDACQQVINEAKSVGWQEVVKPQLGRGGIHFCTECVKRFLPVEVGDVVQITDESFLWFGCLVIVSELKGFGILGYIAIPSGTAHLPAYIRLTKDQFSRIGKAIVVLDISDPTYVGITGDGEEQIKDNQGV